MNRGTCASFGNVDDPFSSFSKFNSTKSNFLI